VLGGWETSLWRFATPDGQRHALRIYPGPEYARGARKEEAALRACTAAGVPVPAVEASGQWEGRPVLVLSWCPGRTYLAAMLRRPWSIWRMGLSFGRQQVRIHRVAPPSALLEGAPDNWLAWGAEQHPDIYAYVRRMTISTTSLIHLDYHPLNVLTDGRQITGIIDWPNAAAGDPRADLARTAVLLLVTSPPPGPTRLLAKAGRRLFYLAWRRGYVSEAGPVGDLASFMAWAGAGIAGLAVGFGAQNLVKDTINGLFILVENQYGKGDVVNIAGVGGLVEDVNLRRTVLRDLDGAVHSIPNSEVTKSSNLTRGWSRVNMNIGVAYGEDLDRVMGVIDRVGQELEKDPDFGPMILSAPHALRVDAFGESGIEIKILGETQPIRQWDVTGELRRRLKKAFDEEKIEIRGGG
jgi:hypothetical protein